MNRNFLILLAALLGATSLTAQSSSNDDVYTEVQPIYARISKERPEHREALSTRLQAIDGRLSRLHQERTMLQDRLVTIGRDENIALQNVPTNQDAKTAEAYVERITAQHETRRAGVREDLEAIDESFTQAEAARRRVQEQIDALPILPPQPPEPTTAEIVAAAQGKSVGYFRRIARELSPPRIRPVPAAWLDADAQLRR